jgi:threonine/homoserine/homoserine lactone efflux protein
MTDTHHLLLFLGAAVVLAITPGPGIFYVLARTLAGGRREGIESALGTFFGGLVHVVAAALGVSAVLAAAYLVWLGIRMIRTRNAEMPTVAATPAQGSFRQGVLTEALNPKTALFFLSFIPQFIGPGRGHVFLQFIVLGAISVTLNTIADLVIVLLAAPLERQLKGSARFRQRQRMASGVGMIGLGAYVAFGDAK